MKQYPVTRPSLPSLEEYMEMIAPIWESHELTNNGPLKQRFQEMLQEKLQVANLSVCSNGHMALTLAIRTICMKDLDQNRNEVITTPFTFASTTEVIVENGLVPVFCDIREEDYTIDADKIEAMITPQTWGIVAVHPYGNLCDIERLERICAERNLHLIYDAAHAFGANYGEKTIGSYGEATCFSLHATKSMQAVEGGIACFRNPDDVKVFEKLCNFGISPCGMATLCGCNAKMSEFHAAMGICNLKRFDEEREKRRKLVLRYLSGLEDLTSEGLIAVNSPYLKDVPMHSYAYFPIRLLEEEVGKKRSELMKRLKSCGIHTRPYFSPAINEMDWIPEGSYGQTPVAARVSRQMLCLPLYADLEESDVERIIEYVTREVRRVYG